MCCIEDIKESLSVYNCVYIAHVMYIMICDDGSLRDGLLLCNSMLVAAVVMVVVVGIHLALGSVFDDFFLYFECYLAQMSESDFDDYIGIYMRGVVRWTYRDSPVHGIIFFLFFILVYGAYRLEAHPYTIQEECDIPHRQL